VLDDDVIKLCGFSRRPKGAPVDEKGTYLQKLAAGHGLFKGDIVPQSGAICIRKREHTAEVLLITSRDTGRWVIPKGSIEKGESARRAAAREAREEAGIRGKVAKKPFGYYTYIKGKEGTACLVSVFLLAVTGTAKPHAGEKSREFAWVQVFEAARRVDEPELKGLFSKLASLA
jgi:8-oxo-dGTP pyrophosphatase MutT (NUDIX family)